MKSNKNTITKTIANPSGCASASCTRLNKILVPIDFSNRSKKALQYGVHFAEQFNASLVLLHVMKGPAATDSEYEEEWKLRLRAWAYEFVPSHVPVQVEVTCGTEAIEIVNGAKNLAIGLMIISTHGRLGRAHALAGSLAETLVHLAPCPVLVIHEKGQDFIETPEFEASSISKESQANTVQGTLSPPCIGADI
ncbi:MAG TPA: universal stress protein [Alphaproteobacteria bacterium]|nr:universal stress protein [Alphaproteobacteria bacterium]